MKCSLCIGNINTIQLYNRPIFISQIRIENNCDECNSTIKERNSKTLGSNNMTKVECQTEECIYNENFECTKDCIIINTICECDSFQDDVYKDD